MKPELELTTSRLHLPPRRALEYTMEDDFSVFKPAGFVLRWYALTLDLALVAPLDLLLRAVLSRHLQHLTAYGHGSRALLYESMALLLPVLLYFILPTWYCGQTLGKRIVGIRVIAKARVAKLSLFDVFLRETFGKFLSLGLCGMGLFMMRKSPRKRMLHDYLGNTMVISFESER